MESLAPIDSVLRADECPFNGETTYARGALEGFPAEMAVVNLEAGDNRIGAILPRDCQDIGRVLNRAGMV